MSDYARYLDDSQRSFARPRTLAEWLHLDLMLLLPLCLIMGLGLLVLFSASDGDWDTVNRQLRNLVVGWGALLVAAQVRIDTIQRWSPVLYLFALGLLLLVLKFSGYPLNLSMHTKSI